MRRAFRALACVGVIVLSTACGSAATTNASDDETSGGDGGADGGRRDPSGTTVDTGGGDTVDVPSNGPALVPGCTAKATLAGYATWLFFTRPDKPCTPAVSGGVDSHVLDELTRLIASVPAGGRIDGHIFSISVPSVAEALLNAQSRGVDVWISADGDVAGASGAAKGFLDQLAHTVYCTSAARSSCIGTADGAISHTKLFTFSTATTPDGIVSKDVVWFGSANQTYTTGMNVYNNTVTIYGDNGLYGRLKGYLDELYARTPHADYYEPSSGRGHVLEQSADVYMSPEVQTDLVLNRLDDVTPDGDCEVRLMQASVRDSRIAVVERLVAMKTGGCKVFIAADTVEPAALAALRAAGIEIRQKAIHDKVFAIYAKYGAAYAHRVYTGSHNLSISAANKYDEIFVKLAPETGAGHPVYDAFLAHFDDAWGDGVPLN